MTFQALGTTFGLLVCFDILHGTPVKELLRKGVKNIVLSNWWVNLPPFIGAVQVQQGWSRWSRMNLLAANAGTNYYNSGSGIYSKGVELAYFYNPTSQPRDMLLIADVNDDDIHINHVTSDKERISRQIDPIYKPKSFLVYPGAKGEIRVEIPGPFPVKCYAYYHVS